MEYGVENEKQKEMLEAIERALLDKPVEEQLMKMIMYLD